jgi:hypothetical protein
LVIFFVLWIRSTFPAEDQRRALRGGETHPLALINLLVIAFVRWP